jgi:hypothetical protein
MMLILVLKASLAALVSQSIREIVHDPVEIGRDGLDDRVGDPLCNVEEIIDDRSVRVVVYRGDIRIPHVEDADLDARALLGAEFREEDVERFLFPSLADPDNASDIEIADHREIAMALFVRDFIDTESRRVQIVESGDESAQVLLIDPFCRFPVDRHYRCGVGERHLRTEQSMLTHIVLEPLGVGAVLVHKIQLLNAAIATSAPYPPLRSVKTRKHCFGPISRSLIHRV